MDAKHRHQLKQNEFAVATMSVADRLSENRKPLLTAAAVIALVAVLWGVFMAYRTRQNNTAGAALGVALAIAEAPIAPAPTLPGATQTPGTYPTAEARAEAAAAAFREVIASHPGTEPAQTASFHLAGQLLAGGQAAEAEQIYAQLAAEEDDSLRGQSARLGRAEALMALGRTDEALEIYTSLAATRDGALPVDGLLMQLGRASQRAGRTDEARAAFQRVIDEFPESSYVMTAQQEIASLN